MLVSEWGGAGTGPGQFQLPEALVTDSQDNLYVVDSGNRRIQKLVTEPAR